MRYAVIIFTIVTLILIPIANIGYSIGKRSRAPSTTVDVTDTVVVRDTVINIEPREVIRYVNRIDTVPIEVEKWAIKNDTVYVPIIIEKTVYKTDDYYAIVEGYKATLLYIETYNKTSYITKPIKTKPKWGFGVNVGYGYAFSYGKSPYVGLSVQYNLITW